MNLKKHIPNALTSSNLFIGSVGIVYIFNNDFRTAFYCVLIASVFDFFDGLSARLLNVTSPIGKQLDSLADLVSFGLLPSFMVYKWLTEVWDYPFPFIAFAIVIFSALRLAKFNIDERQENEFIGLNTPANTLLITSLVFWSESNFLESKNWLFTNSGLIILTLVSSFLLVSPIRFFSFKFKRFQWRENIDRYGFILCLLLSFYY